ncbi:MAG: HAD hydrolase-like protein [Gammaproteobacteria bacterium]
MLEDLHELNLKVGALTNRNREFMIHEVSVINNTGWEHFFHTIVCGDDVLERKPAPDQILLAFYASSAIRKICCLGIISL